MDCPHVNRDAARYPDAIRAGNFSAAAANVSDIPGKTSGTKR
jgi:hypothetical protein